ESGGNCYALREPHRGESPMTHTWKLLGLNTLLAAALATPALAGQLDGPPAGQVEGNKPDPVLEKLKGLENKLDAMESSLKAKLDNLDTNVQLKNAKLQTDVEDLKRQITQLRQDLDAIRTREIAALRRDMEDPRNRQSNYPSTAAPNGTA